MFAALTSLGVCTSAVCAYNYELAHMHTTLVSVNSPTYHELTHIPSQQKPNCCFSK